MRLDMLSAPWKVATRTDRGTVTLLKFNDGASLSVFDNGGRGAGPLAGSTPSEPAAITDVYGTLASRSKYERLRAEFNAAPSDVSFWHSRKSNARALDYLGIKAAMIGNATVVYTIAAGRMHGFQIGGPGLMSSSVFLRLFDGDDHEIWMIFHRAPDGEPTQEQINAVVESLHATAQGCTGPGCA